MCIGIYLNDKYICKYKDGLNVIYNFFAEKNIAYKIIKCDTDLDGVDVMLVLGGDGTILTLAGACAMRGVKIMGVNYGNLGFLAEFEHEKLADALHVIYNANYETTTRTMLEVSFNNKTFLALNDVVVQRCTSGTQFSNTINLRAEIDGSVVDNYASDGLIVSTPTGSTAYSLSAGGSVLSPDINAFIMTPICAHSLHSRPIVYNDNSVLKLYPSNEDTLNVVVDGKVVDVICDGTTLTIKKSNYSLDFISSGDVDFYNKLLIKLNIWSK